MVLGLIGGFVAIYGLLIAIFSRAWLTIRRQKASLTEVNAKLTERNRELEMTTVAAEEANRAKSQFLANMSHEIRTPITGIMGMTDLALDTDLTDEQQDYLETARSSSEALLSVVNDVLDFSKIEAEKLQLDCRPFDLTQTVANAVRTLSFSKGRRDVDLRTDVAPDVPTDLLGDPDRLRQVLLNLVGNATRFTEAGHIAVTVSLASEPVRDERQIPLHFSVEDTGIGIAPDQLDTIFEPFTQADNSTTRTYGGTGLGLAISKQIVQLMGGRIWAESRLGTGSTFHFTACCHLPETLERTVKPPRRALRVLLVDDDFMSQKLSARALVKRGHTLEVADDEMHAIDLVKHLPFDVVVVNVDTPSPASPELWNRLAAGRSETPIVGLSAHEDPNRPAADGRTDACLAKPFSGSELVDTVERLASEASKVQQSPERRG